ncbi:MAG: PilN domain-containing protein [Candidatus Babeliales bacterium]
MNSINFIKPNPPKKQEAFIRWYQQTIFAFFLVIVILCCISGYYGYILTQVKKHHTELTHRNYTLQTNQEKNKVLATQKQALEHRLKKLTNPNTKKNPVPFLEHIANSIPGDVALSHFKQEEKKFFMEGDGATIRSIMSFRDLIKQLPIVANIHLQGLHQLNTQSSRPLMHFTLKGTLH